MSSLHHLQYSQSVIVNVLRAIISRSISNSPPPTTNLADTASGLLLSSTTAARSRSLFIPFSHRRFYSSSSSAISVGLTNDATTTILDGSYYKTSKYAAAYGLPESDKLHQRQCDNSEDGLTLTADKLKTRKYHYVYLPHIGRCVNMKKSKLPKKKPTTTEDYNELILYAALNDQHNKAIKYLKEMERQQLQPTTESYTMVINAFSKQSDMTRAMKWLKRMRNKKVKADVYTYTSLIDGYMRLCNVDEAERVFRDMMNHSVKPNIVTYNVLMHHSVSKLDVETAIKFWGKLTKAGLQADVYTYAILIHGLGNEELVDEAWRLFEQMKQQKVDINEVVTTTLMGIHVKHKDNRYAIQLFQDFFQRNDQQQEPLTPTRHTQNVLLNAVLGNTDLDKINEYYREFQSLLDAKHESSAASTSSALWGNHSTVSNSVYTYTSFMRAYLRRDDIGMVSRVYQDMVQRKVKPTLVTFATLMLAHAFVPDPRACENMLKEIQGHGIKSNVALYTIVMRAWAKAKEFDQVKRVYDEMTAQNIQPNKMTLEVLRWAKERTSTPSF